MHVVKIAVLWLMVVTILMFPIWAWGIKQCKPTRNHKLFWSAFWIFLISDALALIIAIYILNK